MYFVFLVSYITPSHLTFCFFFETKICNAFRISHTYIKTIQHKKYKTVKFWAFREIVFRVKWKSVSFWFRCAICFQTVMGLVTSILHPLNFQIIFLCNVIVIYDVFVRNSPAFFRKITDFHSSVQGCEW